MFGVGFNIQGVNEVENSFSVIQKNFQSKLPFNEITDKVVIPGIKRTFKQRGSTDNKWPSDFEPPSGLEDSITKRSNLNIVVRKDGVKITPKNVKVEGESDFNQLVKRSDNKGKTKRTGNPIMIVNPDGKVVLPKKRSSGKGIDIITIDKKDYKEIGKIIRLWVAKFKFKKV